jgi:hypothetical protein
VVVAAAVVVVEGAFKCMEEIKRMIVFRHQLSLARV